MKLTKPFMTNADGPGGGGSIPSGKGHLFGDAHFNADYFHVGNEASEKTFINMENEELEIHNLVEPTEDNDAATKKYVDDNAGGGGTMIYVSETEPSSWSAGDWWYELLEGGAEPEPEPEPEPGPK